VASTRLPSLVATNANVGKIMDDPLKQAIADFQVAFAAFKQAEKALNVPVQDILRASPTRDDLNDLLDLLPASYRGVRRIYETLELMGE
jgi:hypothetical protein